MKMEEDKIFNNDPIYMMSLIGKQVEVTTIENVIHKGIVYVIDPIFKTIVLNTNKKSNGEYETTFVLHHGIKSLNVLCDTVDESYLKSEELKPEVNSAKRNLLKKWLQHMSINVLESGDSLQIEDHVTILPPYELENCICNNTIILDRIQKIIKLMPYDFK